MIDTGMLTTTEYRRALEIRYDVRQQLVGSNLPRTASELDSMSNDVLLYWDAMNWSTVDIAKHMAIRMGELTR